MSSNPLNRLGRTISFRLNLWHASIFTVSACLLYVVLYFLISIGIERQDRGLLCGRRPGAPGIHPPQRCVKKAGTLLRPRPASHARARFPKRTAGLGRL